MDIKSLKDEGFLPPEESIIDVEPVEEPIEDVIPKQETSWTDNFKGSTKYNTIQGWAYRNVTKEDFRDDPNFSITPELLEQVGDIPTKAQDDLFEAKSALEFNSIAEELRERNRHEQALAEAGWSGVTAEMAAQVTDIPSMAIGVATGAGTVGTAGAIANKGYRISKLLRSAMVTRKGKIALGATAGAIENTAIDSFLLNENPYRDTDDIIYSAVAGGVFGGVGGAFHGIGQKHIKKQEAKDLKPLIDSGEIELNTNYYDNELKELAEEPKVVDLENENITYAAQARYDQMSYLKSEKRPKEVRDLASQLGVDPVGNKDGGVLKHSIAVDSERILNTNALPVMRDLNKSYQASVDSKTGLAGKVVKREFDIGRQDFMENVGLAVRSSDEITDVNIKKGVDSLRNFYRGMLKQAQEAGVSDFSNIVDNPNYLPRVYRADKIQNLAHKHSPKAIKSMLTRALINGSENILDEKYASKIINGIYSNIAFPKAGEELNFSRIMDSGSIDKLRELLELNKVNQSDIDDIANVLTPKDAGKHNRSKHRLTFDETYIDPETGVKFTDLLENNAQQLTQIYSQQLSGSIAFAKHGYKSVDDWDNHVRKTLDKARESYKIDTDNYNKVKNYLDNIKNQVLGKPNEDMNGLTKSLTLVKNYNNARVGGGFMFPSISEGWEVVADVGFAKTLQHVPGLNKLFSKFRKGDVDDRLLKEMEMWIGSGADFELGAAQMRYDQEDVLALPDSNSPASRFMDAALRGTTTLKKATHRASGLAALTRGSQRTATLAKSQQFFDMAHGLTSVKDKRLNQLGIDDEMRERIFSEIRKHSKAKKGLLTGQKIQMMNYEKWTDHDAVTSLANALTVSSNRMIQKQMAGELPDFMTRSTGQTLFQFTTFVQSAWAKKSVNLVYHRDAVAAKGIALTTTSAAMVYTVRTYLNSLGQEDPQAYRDLRLTPENIAKAGIQMGGYWSMLPMAVDTAVSLTGYDPIFQYARSSGLGTDVVSGNPTVDLLNSSGKAVSGAVQSITNDDYEWSQQDKKNLIKLMPWQTMQGTKQVFDSLGHDLPKYSE